MDAPSLLRVFARPPAGARPVAVLRRRSRRGAADGRARRDEARVLWHVAQVAFCSALLPPPNRVPHGGDVCRSAPLDARLRHGARRAAAASVVVRRMVARRHGERAPRGPAGGPVGRRQDEEEPRGSADAEPEAHFAGHHGPLPDCDDAARDHGRLPQARLDQRHGRRSAPRGGVALLHLPVDCHFCRHVHRGLHRPGYLRAQGHLQHFVGGPARGARGFEARLRGRGFDDFERRLQRARLSARKAKAYRRSGLERGAAGRPRPQAGLHRDTDAAQRVLRALGAVRPARLRKALRVVAPRGAGPRRLARVLGRDQGVALPRELDVRGHLWTHGIHLVRLHRAAARRAPRQQRRIRQGIDERRRR
mmetsp:Transcript_19422/g.66977  ORF Transcript_19422/g.66977 Transcript_19422/m.66977 type:complete len:364 (+) Transcript_19422:470-1561(+)